MCEVNKFSMEMLCVGTEVDGDGNIEPIRVGEETSRSRGSGGVS